MKILINNQEQENIKAIQVDDYWVDIKDYPNYQVSDTGKIKTTANNATKKERILKPKINKQGYNRVGLYKNNKVKFFSIHRLVITHFGVSIKDKLQINHIDADKNNNHISNLEWCNGSENILHAYKMNLIPLKKNKK